MNSFSYSLQEAPSTITQSLPDEFERIIMELKGYSMDVFGRKYENRANTFTTVRVETKKVCCRAQDLLMKFKEPIDAMQEKIVNATHNLAINKEEGKSLEKRNLAVEEDVQRKQEVVDDLKERESLTKAIIVDNNESMELIKSGSNVIRRIEKRCPCPNPG
ncbi:unnamed protein product [Cylicocyclus nassatus]|uniref:Uncharacterized protein n=1 Tax=Cylicocyclus nassatus TaxID=53992 RepID=A0AA36GVF5_CYLNA|nr:unnamed protein product [Cylicocyclus nassatus]